MPLRDAIAALVLAAPPDATIPVRWLAEQLATDSATKPDDSKAGVDLTIDDVTKRIGRKSSTVRSWCIAGMLPGAYKLFGREWRIPVAALEEMQRTAAKQQAATRGRTSSGTVNLGAWREHVPKTKAS